VTSAFPLHRYTFDDYVQLEDGSSTKHEFVDGEILAMAGGTPEHAAMAAYVVRMLGNQLAGGPCRVFSLDLGVRVVASGLSTYADTSVVCGRTERDPKKPTNVLNPKVLVEVTSDGTEHYDRGPKLEHYQRIPSLEAVVVVSHREPAIDVWTRDGDGWRHARYSAGQAANIAPIQCTLAVSAVFEAAAEPSD
jgi:Uma2 family endonuclease